MLEARGGRQPPGREDGGGYQEGCLPLTIHRAKELHDGLRRHTARHKRRLASYTGWEAAMYPHPRSPARCPCFALALLALLLPLIAACGSAATPASVAPASGLGAGGQEPAIREAFQAPIGATAAPAGADGALVAPQPASAPTEAPAAPASAAPAALPTPPPPQRFDGQQFAPLKAGEVDDNADFAAYLDYLRSYSGPPTHVADVSERYIITVVNDRQQPVLDARVRLFDGDRPVFEGRTYAGGKTIVFPRALGISEQVPALRMLVEKGNHTVEGMLQRGQDETQTVVLPDAVALSQPLRLDVLFLLDSTGSMGDEIAQIQRTIVSIAERIDQLEPRPALRFGLVAYRDRGDLYVTRAYDFTPDVAAFRELLLSVSADGGGDTPESLNEALHAAVNDVGWADDAVRLIFLVADAPPHRDYPQDYDYLQEVRAAVAQGIKVYPIAASNSDEQAEYVFRQLAQQTLAHFIFLTYQPGQNAGPPGDTTVHHVDPQAFTVERLDDLVVQVVQRELARALGMA